MDLLADGPGFAKPLGSQLKVTVVVHGAIFAGMGARTASATIAPSMSVEKQAAAIETLRRRMGGVLGTDAALARWETMWFAGRSQAPESVWG